MTNTFKSSVFSAIAASLFLVAPMAAQADNFSAGESFEVAGTIGMDNRDDRRGDRQDCRVSEGAAGGDKRDCKQDSRQG